MQAILSSIDITQKINRIAFQILENSVDETKIFIAGICGNGLKLAESITNVLRLNTTKEIVLFEIQLNKHQPLTSEITLSISEAELKHSFIVLIDDVLNSGKTMQYALLKLLESDAKEIKTVALVDRKHRKFPIKCDFVGLSLSTTLKNHVEVAFENNNFSAYLV